MNAEQIVRAKGERLIKLVNNPYCMGPTALLDGVREFVQSVSELIESLQAQLAASQRRERAMEQDIPIAVHHHQGCCSICRYAVWDEEMVKWMCTAFAKWPRHECFKWRGPQKAGEEIE